MCSSLDGSQKPRDHQDRRHRRPRHPLASARQQPLAELGPVPAPATASSPARHRRTARAAPGAPAPAAPAPARAAPLVVSNSSTARPGRRDPRARARPARGPARRVRRAARPSPGRPCGPTHRAHQPPVGVGLAVLRDRRVAQVHRRDLRPENRATVRAQQPPRVGTTRAFRAELLRTPCRASQRSPAHATAAAALKPARRKIYRPPNCGSWASVLTPTVRSVIPGRGLQPASPESITQDRGYRFRARALWARPGMT